MKMGRNLFKIRNEVLKNQQATKSFHNIPLCLPKVEKSSTSIISFTINHYAYQRVRSRLLV